MSTPTWKLQSASTRICREGDVLLDIYSAVLYLHMRLEAIEASLQGVPYIQHQATHSCFSMPSCYHGQSSSACTSGSSGIGSGWALSTIPGSTVQVYGGWAPSTGPIPVTDPGLSGSSHPVNPMSCKERETDDVSKTWS